jgi:dTDP-4-amino-4,6-dideoxygalactose transaminase
MNIPLIDLVAEYRSIQPEIDKAIADVLDKAAFILGPNVAALEKEVAEYLDCRYAIGVASGTDALQLSLVAIGIGAGDEVIVPAYTFFATAEVVSSCQATPVFVDIDPKTYCIDVTKLKEKLSPRSRAIIPVHLYGHPADMDPILQVAKERGLAVIEDNAQGMGATYKSRRTGSLGDCGCLSFFPSKNLGCFGDGGMVVTNDARMVANIRKLRTHGWDKKYEPEMIGHNSRLDELQAAVLRVKLRYLDQWNERRRKIAACYVELLGDDAVHLPWEKPEAGHVYHVFVIRVKDRQPLIERLKSRGIATSVYYPLALHELEPYRHLNYKPGSFPEAERAARETLAIPLYPEMTDEQVRTVAREIRRAVVGK